VRVLVALGGNAMTGPDGRTDHGEQIAAAGRAASAIADVVATGWDVVITHGNGPQVGDLLVRSELAASLVPPSPLDWCVAETQATLGFVLLDSLDAALSARGVDRRTAAVLTRTLVDPHDPGFARPTKPIGRFLSQEEARRLMRHGQKFADLSPRGWRRVVASPEPLEIVDGPVIATLVAAGFIVVANGGGGVPVVREAGGSMRGVEAVIDKDLGAALLAQALDAHRLVIGTDVDQAMLDFGTPSARPLGAVGVGELRAHQAEGQFGAGSMGPKVEAVCRFVESTGGIGVITSLDSLLAGVAAEAGTVVHPDAP
jgi:carbamate kinase